MKWKTPYPEFQFHAAMIEAGLGKTSTARKELATAINMSPAFDPIDARTTREELA